MSHEDARPVGAVPLTAFLIGTIAIQTAVPPFATDMYTPAFPRVMADLGTSAASVGLTLTTFFLGFGLGQFVGGPWSDQRGRRVPILFGGFVCMLGALGCAISPSIFWLIVARVVQGFGGGIAAAVARAVIVDVARGTRLAKVLSVMQAIGGLAPMIAPVAGALVLTVSNWRAVFWCLVLFGALMVITAAFNIPETLPPERRHPGGVQRSLTGIVEVVRIRPFLVFMLICAFSNFAMMAYVANSSYVLQVMKGMKPLEFSFFFAGNALLMVVFSLVNARLVGRIAPLRLIWIGLATASCAVVSLLLGVLFWGTPLLLTCVGFVVLLSSQSFIFGNAGALAASKAVNSAGAAAAVQGVATSLAGAIASPLASAGGGSTALPMVLVMVAGVGLSIVAMTIAMRL